MDQMGFVLCRQGGDNTKRTIDVDEVVNRHTIPVLLLSLDAGIAFARLNWSFMIEMVESFGISGSFLQALKGLHSCPLAPIKLLHASSPMIQIQNSTRQCCLLSPLLFILCLSYPLKSGYNWGLCPQ